GVALGRNFLLRQVVPRVQPDHAAAAGGPGQPGGLPGLRRLYGGLSLRGHGPQGLHQCANHGGGGRDMQVNGQFQPTIVAFCCNWCSYAGADLSGTNRLQYPANVKIIRIPCRSEERRVGKERRGRWSTGEWQAEDMDSQTRST